MERRPTALFRNRAARAALVLLLSAGTAFWLLSDRLFSALRGGEFVSFGDDLMFHCCRLLSIADGLRGGQFPVWIYPAAANGYGYGSPLFYPDLFLYPFALLVLAGMDYRLAFCLLQMAAIVAFGCTLFLCARSMLRSFGAALAVSALGLCLQYVSVCTLNRAALGEQLALIFWPIVLLGLFDMTERSFSKPRILLFGMLGMTYSHLLSLALAAGVCAIAALLRCRRLFPDRRFWKKLGLLLLTYFVLGGAFLFPLAETLLSQSFQLSALETSMAEQALSVSELWQGIHGVGPFALLLLGGATIFLLLTKRTAENKARRLGLWVLFALLLVLLFATTSLFPWNFSVRMLPFLRALQFPWRLNALFDLGLPFYFVSAVRECFAAPILPLPSARIRGGVSLCLLLALCVGMTAFHVSLQPEHQAVRYVYDSLGTEEYRPAEGGHWEYWDGGFSEVMARRAGETDWTPIASQRRAYSVVFTFESDGYEEVRLPLFYYKGYRATLVRADGTTVPLSVDCAYWSGMSVATQGLEGTVTVEYAGTFLQKASFALSVLGAAGGVVVWTLRRGIESRRKHTKTAE